MRVRFGFAVAVTTSAVLFWACGDTSFSSESADDGGSVSDGGDSGIGSDGSSQKDGGSGGRDGSVGADGGPKGDGGTPICSVEPTIMPLAPGSVFCGGTDDTPTVCDNRFGPCCFNTSGLGDCLVGGCAFGQTSWDCEKTTDCDASVCCVTLASKDVLACPATASPSPVGSACAPTCAGPSAKMCTTNGECGAGTCKPVYVEFGGTLDAGTLVGICVL